MNVKRVFVSPELIVTMLTTGYVLGPDITVAEGLPKDAVLTAIGWDVATRCWALDFCSPSFPWTDQAQLPPVLEVVLQKKSGVLTDALTE
jgi:hypothetical protein